MKEEFLKVICGEDDSCKSEVLDEIRLIFSAPPLQAEGGAHPPLISYDGGDLLTFIRKARYLREKFGDRFKDWNGDFCPICGLKPVVFVRREAGDIFVTLDRYAKCSCGFEWRYSSWRCPSCGRSGRENFAVYKMGNALIYRCKKCGFKTAEVDGEDEETIYLARVVINYVD